MNIPDFIIDPSKDFYSVLQVSPNSDPKQIKHAHKKLSMKYHPDRATGDEDKFKEVQEAWEVLGDPDNKKYYDSIRGEYSSNDHSWNNTGKTYRRRRAYDEDPWRDIRQRTLKDFVIDSLFLFQEKLGIVIPDIVQNNFNEAVDFVYSVWHRVKEAEYERPHIVQVSLGAFTVSKKQIGEFVEEELNG